MHLTLSLGDVSAFCSTLCGVVCVIGAPHIGNGPCCRVVAITSIIFTAQLCWGGFPLNVVPFVGENLKLSNSRWMYTAVTVLSTYSTCSCVPLQGDNS